MAKYRVAGSRRVFGVEPGDTFERDIDPVTEERLLQGGAITRVSTRRRRLEPEETTPAVQAEQTEAPASEEVINDG